MVYRIGLDGQLDGQWMDSTQRVSREVFRMQLAVLPTESMLLTVLPTESMQLTVLPTESS